MKSMNVKKVAAVAAGTALVGTALAGALGATVNMDKSFIVNDQGNANVQIVIGQDAQVSDGISAANLAASIGNKAYTVTEGGEEMTVQGSEIGATGNVVIETGGGAIETGSGETLKVPNKDGDLTTTVTYPNTFLVRDTLTVGDTDYDYDESIDTSDELAVAYDEDGDDYADIFLDADDGSIVYSLEFDQAVNIGEDEKVAGKEITFLGEDYLVNEWTPTDSKIELVKGETKTLGIGQSADVTVGDETYTVTLKSADLNEAGDGVGYATVDVTTPEGDTQELSLDTADNQDQEVGDFLVFLQAAMKSYTPGVGGSAKLRMGGNIVTLEDGDAFELDNRYDAIVEKTGSCSGTSDCISRIALELNRDGEVNFDDQAKSIEGPNGYFEVNYKGTDESSQAIERTDVSLSSDTGDQVWDTITYTDSYNERETSFQLVQEDDDGTFIRTFVYNEADTVLNLDDGVNDYIVLGDGVVAGISDWKIDESLADSSDYELEISEVGTSWSKENLDGTPVDTDATGGPDAVEFTDVEMPSNGGYDLVNIRVNVNGTGSEYDALVDYSGEKTYEETDKGPGAIKAIDSEISINGELAINPGTNSTSFNVTETVTGDGNEYNVTYSPSDDYPGIEISAGGSTVVNTGKSDVELADEQEMVYSDPSALTGVELHGDGGDARLSIPDGAIDKVTFIGKPAGGELPAGTEEMTVDDFSDPIQDLTITANDYSYTTSAGKSTGSVNNLVVDDSGTTSGNAIVIGGHMVNDLAVGVTENELTTAGDEYLAKSGNTIYAAGYTAEDTQSVVNDLINTINVL